MADVDAEHSSVELAAPERTIAVLDAEGKPTPADVQVYRSVADAEPSLLLRTDEAGHASAPLDVGSTVVALTSDGRAGLRHVENGTGELRVHVFGPVALRGRVADLDTDAPIAGARVLARWVDAPDGLLSAIGQLERREFAVETDPTGGFDLTPFRAGLYRLEISAEGFRSYVDERPWWTSRDWDMGTVPLEALGELAIQLLGHDPAAAPTVSCGIDGPRVQVDAEGRAKLAVPLHGEPQHFSIWLADGSMMNVYRRGTLAEVDTVTVRVGAARSLRVHVDGDEGAHPAGRLSLRARFSPEPGLHAEWNRDLERGAPFETDCIDGDFVAVDLVALVERWPNVLSSKLEPVAPSGVTEVTLAVPDAVRHLSLVGVDGAPLAGDVFVELRRPHDTTRWIASGYPDAGGRVIWPDVAAPELFCSGVLTWGPPETFFVDLRLPNSPGTAPMAPLVLGPLRPHRVRVLRGGAPLGSARVRVLGRHTDQPWTFLFTDEAGWSPVFQLTAGSDADIVVDDPRVEVVRVPIDSAEIVVEAPPR